MAFSLLNIKNELEKLLERAGSTGKQFGQQNIQPFLNTPLPQPLRQPVNFINQGLGRVSQAVQQQPQSFIFPPLRPVINYALQSAKQNVGELSGKPVADPEYQRLLEKINNQGHGSLSWKESAYFTSRDPMSGIALGATTAPMGITAEARLAASQGQAALRGLLNESPAQTTFRRSAGVNPGEMYRGLPEPPPPPEGSFTPVTKKINSLDWWRTPENVLKKIGLGDQAVFLRQQFGSYQKQLPEELTKISNWMKEAPGIESSKKIFNYLDGKLPETNLQPNESKVAGEIKSYLKQWAIKLKLPQDRQVSSYITHIFEKDQLKSEFPDELAKLIDEKVAGSVYNPFLQNRKPNDIPYLQDTWRALQAYTKRATRAYNMDPALEALKTASNNMELSQVKYVQNLTDRINMRPTDIDTQIDNLIKSTPGIGYRFGQRPTATITKGVRQQIYRGALGLNVGSALRNLSQGVNTYAQLGERWTITGYLKLARNFNSPELDSVLSNSFIEDRNLSVFKNALSKIDQGLMFFFEQAEKINRGAAYFGAKSKALSQGMREPVAISYAKEMVRKTQFAFGSIDTPVAMQSDLVKTLTQFGSYSIKQMEFLAEMAKNKEYVGLIRYLGATLVLMKVFKDSLGIKLDLLPQLGLSPTGQVVRNIGPALYGNDQQKVQARKNLLNTATMLIPAGIQGKKTIQGLSSYNKGYSESKTDLVQYPIQQNNTNLIRGTLFGKSSFPEAQKYYDTKAKVLGKNQSELIKQAQDKQAEYQKIMNKRQESGQVEKLKQLVQATGQSQHYGGYYAFVDKNGDTRTLDKSFQPTAPNLTGNAGLDKQLLSKFNSEVTKKKNIITDLYEQRQLTADEAEKQLTDLSGLKARYTAPKIKKTPMFKTGKIKTIKIKIARFKVPKMIKIKPIKIKKLKNRRYTIKA